MAIIVNSNLANSGNTINHWSMNWNQFKGFVSLHVSCWRCGSTLFQWKYFGKTCSAFMLLQIFRILKLLENIFTHPSFFKILVQLDELNKKKLPKKLRDLTRNWTNMACLAVRDFNHYTRMFSVLVWGCNWILFMHGWFCPIRLIHSIG